MGSGFPRKSDTFKGLDSKDKIHYANHPWNLNNLPVLRESVLSHIKTDISGFFFYLNYFFYFFRNDGSLGLCWNVF